MMKKYEFPLWVPLVILFVIGVAGFWAPNYVPAFAEAFRERGGEQWLGFAGSIVAAIIAAIAIRFAWKGIVLQTRISMLSKEEERYESELPGLHEARQKLFGWLTLMDPEDPQMTISYLEKHKLSGVDIVEAVQSQMPHLDDRTKRSLTELLIRVNVALMMAAVAATTAGGDWSLPEERQRLKDAIARLNAFYVELGSRISRIEGALPRMREEIERFVQK